MIPNTSDAQQSGVIGFAGGPGGFLYLAFQDQNLATWFLRSTDGGSTWSMAMSLTQQSNNLHLAAAKYTVAVLTDANPGSATSLLWSSIDGGTSFPSPTFLTDTNLSVGVSPDGTTEWLLELQGSTNLEKSTDAGQTFAVVGSVGFSLFPTVIGNKSLFGLSNQDLVVDSLADPTMVQEPASFNGPNVIALDDVDTATVLDTDPMTQRMRATRAVATNPANPVLAQTLVGPSAGSAGVVALSRKAAAIAFESGNVILFSTVVFP